MKKICFGVIAAMFLLVSCGPSDLEKAEKAKADSIRVADSIALVQAQAATATVTTVTVE